MRNKSEREDMKVNDRECVSAYDIDEILFSV